MIRLPICVDGMSGYVDEHGEIVIPLEYRHAYEFSEALAPVWRLNDDTLYIIDMDGAVLARAANAESYSSFSEGRLSFHVVDEDGESGDKGYLDKEARVVIPPTFSNALSFEHGLAVVALKKKYGVIDRQGAWVVKPQFDYMWPFQKGEQVTPFQQDDRWGLVSRDGDILVKARYHDALYTCEGQTPVSVGSGSERVYGMVDARGKWIIPPTFSDCAGHFQDRMHAVAVDGKWGMIDLDGNWYIEPRFGSCGSVFNEDTFPAEEDGKWGVIDRSGDWVISPKYTCTDAFYEGLSCVYVGGGRDEDDGLVGGKFGYIDRDGEFVFEPQFDRAYDFKNGVSEVDVFPPDDPYEMKTKSGWIHKSGKFIWKPTR